MDEEQTARLLASAKGTRLHIPILIAVATGMRRGEVLGLRWNDVDLKAGRLAVRQSLERTKAGVSFKQLKTQKSRRVVALPSLIMDELTRHKGEQAQQRLLLGDAYQNQGPVVAQPDGTPMSPHALSIAFCKMVKRVGVPPVRFHDLRHSHASQLLRHGIHPKVVSERLGHATVGITLDTYSYVLPGLQEEAAWKVNTALRDALGDHRESS